MKVLVKTQGTIIYRKLNQDPKTGGFRNPLSFLSLVTFELGPSFSSLLNSYSILNKSLLFMKHFSFLKA